MKVYTLYGIPNCSSVKKARDFMESHNIKYEFKDFKKEVPTLENLKKWYEVFGDEILNKKGTTFRQNKVQLEGLKGVALLKALIEYPSAIKRPILEKKEAPLILGFELLKYQEMFK